MKCRRIIAGSDASYYMQFGRYIRANAMPLIENEFVCMRFVYDNAIVCHNCTLRACTHRHSRSKVTRLTISDLSAVYEVYFLRNSFTKQQRYAYTTKRHVVVFRLATAPQENIGAVPGTDSFPPSPFPKLYQMFSAF